LAIQRIIVGARKKAGLTLWASPFLGRVVALRRAGINNVVPEKEVEAINLYSILCGILQIHKDRKLVVDVAFAILGDCDGDFKGVDIKRIAFGRVCL